MLLSKFLAGLTAISCASAASLRARRDAKRALSGRYSGMKPTAVNHTVSEAVHHPSSQAAITSKVTSMYAFEGFVYDLENCPSSSKMVSDFKAQKAMGARTVLSTLYCYGNDGVSYYNQVISAAQTAGLNIIPCIWTLPLEDGETFSGTIVPRINAVTQAVVNNPGPVLAVALGDEPLYDWDFGDPETLAQYINSMKSTFKNKGLSIPVSISELAYGWQQAGDFSSVQSAVDFYMSNNFPYFSQDATTGGSSTAWNDFLNDMNYYKSIAQGKPLMVTQTGWPSNKDLYAPNSPNIQVNVANEEANWNLLNSHCSDYFKANNIAWMWRSYDDTMDGWGVKTTSGTNKWSVTVKSTC